MAREIPEQVLTGLEVGKGPCVEDGARGGIEDFHFLGTRPCEAIPIDGIKRNRVTLTIG